MAKSRVNYETRLNKVIDWIANNPGKQTSSAKIANIMGIKSYSAGARATQLLVAQGVIELVTRDRNGSIYKLVDDSQPPTSSSKIEDTEEAGPNNDHLAWEFVEAYPEEFISWIKER